MMIYQYELKTFKCASPDPRSLRSACPDSSVRSAGPAPGGSGPTAAAAAARSPHLDCTPENRASRQQQFSIQEMKYVLLFVLAMHAGIFPLVLTRAWKEDTEKTPRRPSMLLDGRLATARRPLGFGSSLPCRLDR